MGKTHKPAQKDKNKRKNRNDSAPKKGIKPTPESVATEPEVMPSIEGIPVWQKIQDFRERRRIKKGKPRKRKSQFQEWLELVITIVIMVFIIRLAIVEAFRIPTSSMEDTLLVGDFLLVNKFVYGVRTPDWIGIPFTKIGFFIPFFRFPSIDEPEPGDIVVFRYPVDPNLSYIKRCVATEGQTVEIRDKQVFVDGKLVPLPPHHKFVTDITYPRSFIEPRIYPAKMEKRNRDNFGPIEVPEGHLFVMGDNRDNSADSRYWGFLPRKDIIGKALIIYFSWDSNKPLLQLKDKVRWERIGNLIH